MSLNDIVSQKICSPVNNMNSIAVAHQQGSSSGFSDARPSQWNTINVLSNSSPHQEGPSAVDATGTQVRPSYSSALKSPPPFVHEGINHLAPEHSVPHKQDNWFDRLKTRMLLPTDNVTGPDVSVAGHSPLQGPQNIHSPSNHGANQFDHKTEEGNSALKGKVVCDLYTLESWCHNLATKTVIGNCFGPRPPVEVLRQWMFRNWGQRGLRIPSVQFLPNNHLLFFFELPEQACAVADAGTWLIKNTPMSVCLWYEGFDPREKRATVPVWCDLPDLPLPFLPWVKEIGAQVGRVLGQKPTPSVNPKWDQQLLIEIDTSAPIKEAVELLSQDGKVLHTQKITYRNLPNACFKCFKQGHLIEDCPQFSKAKKGPSDDGFQNSSRKAIPAKGKAPVKPKTHINRFAPLLVEVDHPLNEPVSQPGLQEDPPSKTVTFSKDSDSDTQVNGMPSSPSSCDMSEDGSEGEKIPDTQMQNFASQLDSIDKIRREELAAQGSVEVVMSQAEEERLPGMKKPIKTKRKKEKNIDPTRASVVLPKPSKNSKRDS